MRIEGKITEVTLDEKVTAFRAQLSPGMFLEPSFPTIAGVNGNGAIVHYRWLILYYIINSHFILFCSHFNVLFCCVILFLNSLFNYIILHYFLTFYINFQGCDWDMQRRHKQRYDPPRFRRAVFRRNYRYDSAKILSSFIFPGFYSSALRIFFFLFLITFC